VSYDNSTICCGFDRKINIGILFEYMRVTFQKKFWKAALLLFEIENSTCKSKAKGIACG
jgi:hypothetical protein